MAISNEWGTLSLRKDSYLGIYDLPFFCPLKKPIGYKWIYKTKTHSDGSMKCYKVNIVQKAICRNIVLITKRHLLQSLKWHSFVVSLLVHVLNSGSFFKWRLKIHFVTLPHLRRFIWNHHLVLLIHLKTCVFSTQHYILK